MAKKFRGLLISAVKKTSHESLVTFAVGSSADGVGRPNFIFRLIPVLNFSLKSERALKAVIQPFEGRQIVHFQTGAHSEIFGFTLYPIAV